MPSRPRFSCLHFVHEIRRELGGVVAAALDVCQAMVDRGHSVTIATCDATDAPPSSKSSSSGELRIVEVGASRFLPTLDRRALATMTALTAEADVAHLHTPWYLGNVQLAKLFGRRELPYVLSVHGMLDHYSMQQKAFKKRLFLTLFGRRLVANASAIHLTADDEKTQAANYAPVGSRARVLPCIVNLQALSRLPGPEIARRAFPAIREDGFNVLFLSRLHPKKGVDLLIEAVARIKADVPGVRLLLAGPGDAAYVDYLRGLVRQWRLDECVEFLGMVQGDAKTSLYQAADVFILPTRQENFGLVLAEAMACGTPVITTRGTDIWREVERGGGRIVELSIAAIADELVRASKDEGLRSTGAMGREFVFEWLDPDRVAAAYEAMYVEAIGVSARP